MTSRRPLIGLALLTALVLVLAAASLLRADRPLSVAAAGRASARPPVPTETEQRGADLVLPDAAPAPELAPQVAARPERSVEPDAHTAPAPAPSPASPELDRPAQRTDAIVSGTVVDGATGAPCEAEIWLSIPGEPSTNLVSQAPGGAFEQRLETPGSYALLARCNGRVGVLRDVPVVLGKRTEGLVVTLREAARVRIAGIGQQQGEEVSVPWTCTLSMDGAPIGVIIGTADAELAVPPGALTARLLVPGTGRREERALTTAPGELTVIRFD